MSLLKYIIPGQHKKLKSSDINNLSRELQDFTREILIPQSVPYQVNDSKLNVIGFDLAIDAQVLPDGLEFQNQGDLFLKGTKIVGSGIKFNCKAVFFSTQLTTKIRAEQFLNPKLVKLTSEKFVLDRKSFGVSKYDYKGFPYFRILLPHLSMSECKKLQMIFALKGLPGDLFGSIVKHLEYSNKNKLVNLFGPELNNNARICIVDSIKLTEVETGEFIISITDIVTEISYSFNSLEHFNEHCTKAHPGIIRLKAD